VARVTLDQAIDALGGIPLKRYCQITGETPNAVYLRRLKGVWIEGVELYKPEGSDWWVDLAAVRAWVKGDVVNAVAGAVRLESQAAVVDGRNGVVPDLAGGVEPVADHR